MMGVTEEGDAMDAAEFTNQLAALTSDDIVAVAGHVRHELATTDGEVGWWRATMAVDGCLRRHGLSRRGGLAAHDAVQAVRQAAIRAGIAEHERDDVTAVARAAADTARACVADASGSLPDRLLRTLLAPWAPQVAFAA
jgi:hypothetical protein